MRKLSPLLSNKFCRVNLPLTYFTCHCHSLFFLSPSCIVLTVTDFTLVLYFILFYSRLFTRALYSSDQFITRCIHYESKSVPSTLINWNKWTLIALLELVFYASLIYSLFSFSSPSSLCPARCTLVARTNLQINKYLQRRDEETHVDPVKQIEFCMKKKKLPFFLFSRMHVSLNEWVDSTSIHCRHVQRYICHCKYYPRRILHFAEQVELPASPTVSLCCPGCIFFSSTPTLPMCPSDWDTLLLILTIPSSSLLSHSVSHSMATWAHQLVICSLQTTTREPTSDRSLHMSSLHFTTLSSFRSMKMHFDIFCLFLLFLCYSSFSFHFSSSSSSSSSYFTSFAASFLTFPLERKLFLHAAPYCRIKKEHMHEMTLSSLFWTLFLVLS